MNRPSPLENIKVPQELILEFFAVFSRFEHALKASGYVVPDRHGNALVDWNRFIKAAEPWFNPPAQGVASAVDYLVKAPPYGLVFKHQNLTWELRKYPQNTPVSMLVLEAVKTVRNNIFHGGKHMPHSPPGRDEQLIQACVDVLYYCLDSSAQIGSEYWHWLY